MGPRLEIPGECPHCRYEQFYSERGLLIGSYVCHHPDKDGCWCVLTPYVTGTCDWIIERSPTSEAPVEIGPRG